MTITVEMLEAAPGVAELLAMDFLELEAAALDIKVKFIGHYAGNKIPTGEFFKLKATETIYNLRSWKEGTAAGPSALNRRAKQVYKGR